jgi:hypothetical protein
MALFTTTKLASLAERTTFANERYAFARKSADRILLEESQQPKQTFDIFLSHSFQDAKLILVVKRALEGLGYSVFVDWVEYPQLDRRHVTKKVAAFLRDVMRQSKSLFYVATDNATHSNWMPWECGYFDGIKNLVAIMPVVRGDSHSDSFEGREYLGLYYYVSSGTLRDTDQERLWIHEDASTYVLYDKWVLGGKP